MPKIATATIKVDPDLGRLTLVMRTPAKHLTACADELAEMDESESHPQTLPSWFTRSRSVQVTWCK
jgi:hypothetical protein